MTDPKLLPRGVRLMWAITALMIGLSMLAAWQNSLPLTYALLALLAVYAVCGIAFGAWASRHAGQRQG